MGGQRFCVVTRDVDEETYRKYPCSSGRHVHIGWAEINMMWDRNELEPVGQDRPGFDGGAIEKRRAGDGEEPDYLFEWLIVGKVIRFKRNPAVRGLSAKYGEYLARMLAKKEPWAQTLIGNMRGQREMPVLSNS